ncbi:hypothetical protein RN001_011143 [Aquatica leii]|uniref:Aminopeptidase n=1 Tax=Aquatica leii TaxID=1421715 RepID=A0AAN7P7J0_9COLE|nr:hypothetical protein RN001_011143 [Aquatica leii]
MFVNFKRQSLSAMTTFCYATIALFCLPLSFGDQYKYLPKTVIPIRYYITLEAHPNSDLLFSGSIAIDVKALTATKNITLHTKDLQIQQQAVRLNTAANENVEVASLDFDNDLCIIKFDRDLIPNERYQLIVSEFFGTLNHVKYGFFLAKYHDAKRQERKIALTYFEPIGARMAFPCFDEPALKATFIVNLIRSGSFHTVSNAELERSVNLGNGRIQDVYKESVIMSTYLVAFAFIDYSYTKKRNRVRVLARRDAIRLGTADYVLNESVKLLKAMEEYTGVNYALDKLDLLGVPSHYFVDGAMENWGLITYSEHHLLYSQARSTTKDLQRCATYTAHELSHQWFGNLVTPSKWNYMWLSEGFAAYFQYYLADVVEPTWRLKDQFVVEELQKSLSNDLVPMAQPMNYVFSNPDEFPSPWTYYFKASAVIRMMEHFLTPAIFRRGLKTYLNRKKFSSSTPKDLYVALQQSVNQARAQHLLGTLTVSTICSTWDTNIGYPLVTAVRNYTTGTITLTQETYNNEHDTDSIWIIPISYATNTHRSSDFAKTTADLWLTQKNLTFNSFKGVNWIVLNKQHSGYFRVNYDAVNWNRLAKFLRTSKFRMIHVLNRAQLINDAFHLVQDGKLSAQIAMDLSIYIKQETDYIALKPFLKHVESVDFMVSVTDEYSLFKAYVKHVLDAAFRKVGLEVTPGDFHVDKLMRVVVSRVMCLYGDARCQNYGYRQLQVWQETGTLQIWHEIELFVLCAGVQIADTHVWEFLFDQYISTTNKVKKTRYIRALGCSRDGTIMTRFLDRLYDFQNTIEQSDRIAGLVSIVQSKIIGIEFVLNYLIVKAIPKNSSFEEAVGQAGVFQIASTKFAKEVNALYDSGNDLYVPVKLYTEDYLEPYENKYIAEVAKWLIEHSSFV